VIRELSSHFAAILRGDHPCHLAIWGKTGTGKTLTLTYFLNLLSEMCLAKKVPLRHEHLDLSNPRPCFRALNDLACLLNASKRYQKGISLEEMMIRIETKLAEYQGYLILFIDEVDIRRLRLDGKWTVERGKCPVNNFKRAYDLILARADVKGQFHDLRHTCLTRWLMNGLTEYDVMSLAGHADFETTRRFYLAVRQDLLERARTVNAQMMPAEFVANLLQTPFRP
jgi:hypothetical protein